MIFLGDAAVGKSSITHQYVLKKFNPEYKATIGTDFLTRELEINDTFITLQIWDTTGDERLYIHFIYL